MFVWTGDTYEAYIGRWSRLVAGEFLGWLNAPRGAAWLDVAVAPALRAKPFSGCAIRRSSPAVIRTRRCFHT